MNRFDLALGRRASKVKDPVQKSVFRQAPKQLFDYCMGVDIGLKVDGTFLSIAHADGDGNIYCDFVEQIPPGVENMSQLADRVMQHCTRWDGPQLRGIMTDQYYGEQFREEVRRRINIPVYLDTVTRARQQEMLGLVNRMKDEGRIRAAPTAIYGAGGNEAFARAVWLLMHPQARRT